ncbi:hypothetical protein [Candidatus Pristimantibacillus sp. PTI5]|uniref:hypothetical protein n=1 Tax=Candidatus Pristimantibacillus sp. PTI5 TaxID=3400422 RepID=UPI003B010AF5
MFASTKVASLLLVLFITTCIGIVSAQSLDKPLEEITSMPVNKVLQDPNESAKIIINDYFTEIMNKKNDGRKLIDFEIVKVNSNDLENIRVSVILKYENDLELPVIDYSIIPINNNYQVVKQYCAYDGDPESQTFGTIKGCTNVVNEDQISIVVE